MNIRISVILHKDEDIKDCLLKMKEYLQNNHIEDVVENLFFYENFYIEIFKDNYYNISLKYKESLLLSKKTKLIMKEFNDFFNYIFTGKEVGISYNKSMQYIPVVPKDFNIIELLKCIDKQKDISISYQKKYIK